MADIETPIAHRSAHPEGVATHAIRVLDAALRERFGVRVAMGTELEFTVHFKPGAPVMNGNTRDPLQLGGKGLVRPATLFPHSRFVQYCYREGGESPAYEDRGAIRQYEAVTDHRHPLPLDRLPRALDQLRHELRIPMCASIKHADTLATHAHRIDQVRATRTQRQAWAQENLEEIRFDSGKGAPIINGLHLNFSLHDTRTGESLISDAPERTQQLVACSRALFADPENMLFSTPRQQMRRRVTGEPDLQIKAAARDPMTTAIGIPRGNASYYIENKTPGADCNMHYAVMMQLAAIYDALVRPGMEPRTSLESILNEVEPDLGTRFMRAERAHPECRSFAHDTASAMTQGTTQR